MYNIKTSTPHINIAQSAWSVLCDVILLTAGYLLYTQAPFFSSILQKDVIAFLPILAGGLFVGSLTLSLYYIFTQDIPYISNSYNTIVYITGELKKLYKDNDNKIHELKTSNRTAFLASLVKLVYIPLMLQFAVSNFIYLAGFLENFFLGNIHLSGNFFFDFNFTIYPFLVGCCFFTDTVFFFFGYLIYSDALGNKIKSVDGTFGGWAVTLLCYPPFHIIASAFFAAPVQDYPLLPGEISTFFLRIFMLLLLFVYTSATVNLGWKCSNLTNRGIVTHGVYAWIRHPAYTAKNLFWWLSILPLVSHNPYVVIPMLCMTTLYVLRALTEERHLRSDPDYLLYSQKVKYRFIPRLL